METSKNQIELLGRLGDDARITDKGEGRLRATFRMATSDVFKSARTGEMNEEVTWHRVTAWQNKNMPDFSGLRKGRRVHILGRMRSFFVESPDGQRSYFYEVQANQIDYL